MISDKGPNNQEVVDALGKIQKQGSQKQKKYKQMGIDLFEKSLMERIEQEKEAERERMLRELKPGKKSNFDSFEVSKNFPIQASAQYQPAYPPHER